MQQPTVSQRIGDATVALNCVKACVIELRERGSQLAAEDLSYAVTLLVHHAKAEGKKLNNSSLARMAGNIASGLAMKASFGFGGQGETDWVARRSVEIARAIAKELEK